MKLYDCCKNQGTLITHETDVFNIDSDGSLIIKRIMHPYKGVVCQVHIQIDSQIDRQIYRKIDRQLDRQTLEPDVFNIDFDGSLIIQRVMHPYKGVVYQIDKLTDR